MKKALKAVLTVSALMASLTAMAQTTPVGLWKTIDDATGKPKSLVRITEVGGQFQGKIEKLFREPGEDPSPVCDKCEGELKNKPALGMTILTGLKPDDGEYTGGKIVDPKDGKTYKAKITLIEGGKKLNMRGYIGMPMLGRTQVWVREE
jgi:uncharacterized protein (DUF2147 family)